MTPRDLAWIEAVIDSWDRTDRWSVLVHTPSLPRLQRLLWSGVALQQAVRTPADEPIALLQLANVDLHNGVAELAVLAHPERSALVSEAITAFLARAFDAFPVRKVLVRAVCGELAVRDLLGAAADQVGCLPRHLRRGEGSFADLELFELWGPAR